ncbi:MAG: hypothetical protein R3B40_18595 [Polyangiales bacterium]|nr:hypothetical protein [Myxococcales bacterium]MCB9657733.1 hypothetical protein [Sandaracinaceae bacterium]
MSENLLRTHRADLFWDASDHQFCPSREAAEELVASMRVEYALRVPDEADRRQ